MERKTKTEGDVSNVPVTETEDFLARLLLSAVQRLLSRSKDASCFTPSRLYHCVLKVEFWWNHWGPTSWVWTLLRPTPYLQNIETEESWNKEYPKKLPLLSLLPYPIPNLSLPLKVEHWRSHSDPPKPGLCYTYGTARRNKAPSNRQRVRGCLLLGILRAAFVMES